MSSPLPPHQPQPGPRRPSAPSPAAYGPQTPAARPQTTTLANTNTFAVVAVILGFIQPIAGIVFGHLALGQIKRSGDAGRGLALTGLVVGYVVTAMWIFFWIFYISVIGAMLAGIGSLANAGYPS